MTAAYRGNEGWQSLRWGMTMREVAAAMKGLRVKPQRAQGFGAAWLTTVADREAQVSCLFASDRLVAIHLAIFRIEKPVFHDLLVKKHGEPSVGRDDTGALTESNGTSLNWSWGTKEGSITESWDFLHGQVFYVSKVFSLEGKEALERLAAEQANDL